MDQNQDSSVRFIPIDDARNLAVRCLQNNGCNIENATAVANIMVRAEADGCPSHGLFRLPGYVAALRSGKVNGEAIPEISHLMPSILKVDACNGFAPFALERSRQDLIDTAKTHGLAAASVVRAHHFSALWCDVEPLVDSGLCAMACTAYLPAMAPYGGAKALFGTNPMAFGWPRTGHAPVIFDQASAAMARGDVMIAARNGETVPTGVGVGPDGLQTTDPEEILKGAMLPFGGHKGSAIAMMVELLAAGLTGDRFSFEAAKYDNKDGGPPQGGLFLLAIDPEKFGDKDWAKHCDGFFEQMLAIKNVRLPGQRRYESRMQSVQKGIAVPEKLIVEISGLLDPLS
nr:Ldh family oxidoreductase [uncultured Roseovarius sp.]